jgi:hypothetical protein
MDSFRMDAFTTKIGLSSGAVTVSSCLRDELPNLGATVLEMISANLGRQRRFS